MSEQITVTRERVTPKKSEAWINANTNNRSLREGVVEQYANDMCAGNWTNCTAPIAFYEDGSLADGQHRLYAIIESGCEQTFSVMRGLSREDGLNVDTGLARSVVDNSRISGLDLHLSNSLVAVARAVAFGMPVSNRLSNSEKLKLVAEHRDACEWANGKMPHRKYVCNSAVMAALARAWYYEDDKERLEQFAKVMGNGFSDGDADSAAIAMRNYMLAHAGVASSTTMWRDTFLKVQNAIQYFMHRKRLTVIKSVKEEAYPLKKKRVLRKVA